VVETPTFCVEILTLPFVVPSRRHFRCGWPYFHSVWQKSLLTRHCTQITIDNRYKELLLLQNLYAFPAFLRIASGVRLRCTTIKKIGQASQG